MTVDEIRQIIQNCGSSLRAKDFKALMDWLLYNFENISLPNIIYVSKDSEKEDKLTNGTIAFPFKTIQEALNLPDLDNKVIFIGPGIYNENITIDGKSSIVLTSYGNTSIIGESNIINANNLIINNIKLSNIVFNGNVGNSTAYFRNLEVPDIIFLQSSIGAYMFNNCKISNVNIDGSGKGFDSKIYFDNCSSISTQGSGKQTINGIYSDVIFTNCKKLKVLHLEGKVTFKGDNTFYSNVGIESLADDHSNNLLRLDGGSMLEDNGTYSTISKVGECYYTLTNFIYNIENKLNGTLIGQGYNSKQVHDNKTRSGYSHSSTNRLEDHLDGISTKFNAVDKELEAINEHLTDHDGKIEKINDRLDSHDIVLEEHHNWLEQHDEQIYNINIDLKDIYSTINSIQKTIQELQDTKADIDKLDNPIINHDYTSDASSVQTKVTKIIPKTGQIYNVEESLPTASETNAGIVPASVIKTQIQLVDDVEYLKNQGGRFIGVSFITKADLDDYIIPSTSNVGDFTYVLKDETKENATTRYIIINIGTEEAPILEFSFAYIINFEPVGIATTENPGLVLSTENDEERNSGAIRVMPNGSMLTIGWDNITDDISGMSSDIVLLNEAVDTLKVNSTLNNHFYVTFQSNWESTINKIPIIFRHIGAVVTIKYDYNSFLTYQFKGPYLGSELQWTNSNSWDDITNSDSQVVITYDYQVINSSEGYWNNLGEFDAFIYECTGIETFNELVDTLLENNFINKIINLTTSNKYEIASIKDILYISDANTVIQIHIHYISIDNIAYDLKITCDKDRDGNFLWGTSTIAKLKYGFPLVNTDGYIPNEGLALMPATTLKGNNTTSENRVKDLTVSEVKDMLDIPIYTDENSINISKLEDTRSVNTWADGAYNLITTLDGKDPMSVLRVTREDININSVELGSIYSKLNFHAEDRPRIYTPTGGMEDIAYLSDIHTGEGFDNTNFQNWGISSSNNLKGIFFENNSLRPVLSLNSLNGEYYLGNLSNKWNYQASTMNFKSESSDINFYTPENGMFNVYCGYLNISSYLDNNTLLFTSRSEMKLGNTSKSLYTFGSTARPFYNNKELALLSDISSSSFDNLHFENMESNDPNIKGLFKDGEENILSISKSNEFNGYNTLNLGNYNMNTNIQWENSLSLTTKHIDTGEIRELLFINSDVAVFGWRYRFWPEDNPRLVLYPRELDIVCESYNVLYAGGDRLDIGDRNRNLTFYVRNRPVIHDNSLIQKELAYLSDTGGEFLNYSINQYPSMDHIGTISIRDTVKGFEFLGSDYRRLLYSDGKDLFLGSDWTNNNTGDPDPSMDSVIISGEAYLKDKYNPIASFKEILNTNRLLPKTKPFLEVYGDLNTGLIRLTEDYNIEIGDWIDKDTDITIYSGINKPKISYIDEIDNERKEGTIAIAEESSKIYWHGIVNLSGDMLKHKGTGDIELEQKPNNILHIKHNLDVSKATFIVTSYVDVISDISYVISNNYINNTTQAIKVFEVDDNTGTLHSTDISLVLTILEH